MGSPGTLNGDGAAMGFLKFALHRNRRASSLIAPSVVSYLVMPISAKESSHTAFASGASSYAPGGRL